MSEYKVNQAILALKQISSDTTIPKSIIQRVEHTIRLLQAKEEIPIKISKALTEIEEITFDNNIESITRTQLFNISTILEII